ncbi:MAG TPA: hypothetical protein VMS86_05045 [Thermoanaerobaculia bacterium]|nr:hypothetical protein [Thermoanaerobaculia bacterium]
MAGDGALPSGTLTFLFTDIEGSTRWLRDLGSAYAKLLEDQRDLLRKAGAEHGGQVASRAERLRAEAHALEETLGIHEAFTPAPTAGTE